MNDLKVGQVLWLKVRYQIDKVADYPHPMIIFSIADGIIQLIAVDKVSGALHQLYHPYNVFISHTDPKEKVIYEDSYAQLNTIIEIEEFDELVIARKTHDTLSKAKFEDLEKRYENYHKKNSVPEE